ncbi:MAG: hypothetical protein DIU56_014560 [Pseudomonadota bacterium]|jgi:hypothetical protein
MTTTTIRAAALGVVPLLAVSRQVLADSAEVAADDNRALIVAAVAITIAALAIIACIRYVQLRRWLRRTSRQGLQELEAEGAIRLLREGSTDAADEAPSAGQSSAGGESSADGRPSGAAVLDRATHAS